MAEVAVRYFKGEFFSSALVLKSGPFLAKPNQVTQFRMPEWDVIVKTNENGYRDYPTAKLNAPRRIIAVGDSFTMGYHVPLEKTFVKKTENFLKNTGKDLNILNTAFAGSHPKIYRKVYQEYFSNDPRVTDVILGFFVGNDLINSGTKDYFYRPGKIITEPKLPIIYQIKVFLGRNSALYNFASHGIKSNFFIWYLAKKIRLVGDFPFSNKIYKRNKIIRDQMQYTIDFVTDFDRTLKLEGRRLVVLIIPTKEQIEDVYWKAISRFFDVEDSSTRFTYNRMLARQLKKHGTAFIDMTKILMIKQMSGEGPFYFRTDGHWNIKGHDIAAQSLAEYFLSNGKDFENTKN